MASSLRRSKWLKMEPTEKWTTLRVLQRQIPSLFTFAEDWDNKCAANVSTFGRQPRFSPTVAASVAVCTSSWLRCLQDTHDIYARKKEPYAEMERKGFRLHAFTYPTKHVERIGDPHTDGYLALLHNDEASRFLCQTPAVATVRVDLQPSDMDAATFKTRHSTLPNCGLDDRALWMVLMKAVTSVLSAAYIHQRVVDFSTDSLFVAEFVKYFFADMIEYQYLYVREPEVLPSPTPQDDADAAKEDAAPRKKDIVVGRKAGRQNHLALRIEDVVFQNSWLVLPSADEKLHSSEWSQRKVKQVARYLVESDASIVYADRKWPAYQQLQDAVTAAKVVNGRQIGSPLTIFPIDDLCQNFPLLVRTHMLSIIAPPSQDSNTPLHKTLAKDLLSTKVVALNSNALDVFSMYPHLQFTDMIGNSHRYLGVERTFLKRHFNSWGNDCGIGSALPIAGRIEAVKGGAENWLNDKGQVGSLPPSPHILFQERLVSFWYQPYLATAFPMLCARYLNI